MALTAYMSVKGKSQGDMKGDCKQGGDKKDKVILYSIDHSVEIPRDPDTGQPKGSRVHRPFTVIKHKDNSSPMLFKACCTGEQCEVVIDQYRIKPDGTEEKFFTIKMEEAIVVTMREYTPMTLVAENKSFSDMEEVAFTYSKITWTYNDGNIEYVDNWKA